MNVINALMRLALKHLSVAGGYAVPEETLFSELSVLTRPPATREEWDDVIIELLQKEMIGFLRDEITDEKKFFIKEAGQTALRRT